MSKIDYGRAASSSETVSPSNKRINFGDIPIPAVQPNISPTSEEGRRAELPAALLSAGVPGLARRVISFDRGTFFSPMFAIASSHLTSHSSRHIRGHIRTVSTGRTDRICSSLVPSTSHCQPMISAGALGVFLPGVVLHGAHAHCCTLHTHRALPRTPRDGNGARCELICTTKNGVCQWGVRYRSRSVSLLWRGILGTGGRRGGERARARPWAKPTAQAPTRAAIRAHGVPFTSTEARAGPPLTNTNTKT
jgi:hypothetical protein